MIDNIGYTDDGHVWMRMIMDVNNQKMTGVLTMTPEFANKIAGDLMTAAHKAGGTDERNSTDVN